MSSASLSSCSLVLVCGGTKIRFLMFRLKAWNVKSSKSSVVSGFWAWTATVDFNASGIVACKSYSLTILLFDCTSTVNSLSLISFSWLLSTGKSIT